MASSLTSAGLKSGFLYILLLIAIVIGAGYFLFLDKPGAVDNLNQHAFRLNFAAFNNGIKLANYRHQVKSTPTPGHSGIDSWIEGEIGLDYNRSGFPIGIHLSDPNQQTPASAADCVAIWQFVLGPLQPDISTNPSAGSYWADINQGVCEFRASGIDDLAIFYDATSGKVLINDVN